MIEISNLHKTYSNNVKALKGVSFNVEKGSFLVVIGLSGSGKSTLLRCINRLIEPDTGEIVYNNQNVKILKGNLLRQYRSKVGMIFQHFNLIPRQSVLVNTLSGALSTTNLFNSLVFKYSKAQKEKAMECLEIVGLKEKANMRADALSGGQQQRVAIARALMQNPDVLLADEPVASLDPATSHSVMNYLREINKKLGITVICNLHFLSLVREYASDVIALKSGEVVFQGKPEEITKDWFKKIYGEEAIEVTIN